jgi:hypothetical protein
MGTMGQSLIYVCGDNAYDNELAMYRHEGIACHRRGAVAPVFEARPRFAYRISLGDLVRWSTDPVDACRVRRQTPDANIDLVAVRR